jgi:hypothetical protein
MSLKCYVLLILLWMHFSLHLILEASLEFFFVRLTPSMMHAALFFVILGQPWLASTQSSRRGRPETTTGDVLLPRAAPLLLPHAMRWEVLAAIAPLLLPRVCRRWEALAAATPLLLPRATWWEAPAAVAPLLLPPPTRMNQWRCRWRLLLLLYAYRWLLLLWHAFGSATTSKRWAHMNTTFRFQMFSIITKCIHSFSD